MRRGGIPSRGKGERVFRMDGDVSAESVLRKVCRASNNDIEDNIQKVHAKDDDPSSLDLFKGSIHHSLLPSLLLQDSSHPSLSLNWSPAFLHRPAVSSVLVVSTVLALPSLAVRIIASSSSSPT